MAGNIETSFLGLEFQIVGTKIDFCDPRESAVEPE